MFVLNVAAIRAAMKRKGICSVERLAQKVGLHRNSIARYMTGKESVFPDSIGRVLEALEIEPCNAVCIKAPPEAASNDALSPLLDELMATLPNCAYVLFGSRSRGSAKQYSDFDIGVFSLAGLSLDNYLKLVEIKERHEDTLPYFVDLVNLNSADANFLHAIAPDIKFLSGRRSDWLELKRRCFQ